VRRPSRPPLLGAGANRIALALLGVLLIVCGLIVGVHRSGGTLSVTTAQGATVKVKTGL
jgi:hypothetical protein